MSAPAIVGLCLVWGVVGLFVLSFVGDVKPLRTAVGIAIAWPVVFAIYAARGVCDAIIDAVSA